MKNIKFLLSLLVIVAGLSMVSCGKHGNSPVDQYCEILDRLTDKIESATTINDLANLQQYLNPEEGVEIIKNNSDYLLTESDKKNLIKSIDRLLDSAYNKSVELSGISGPEKEMVKSQIDLAKQAMKVKVESSTNLGEMATL